MKKWRLKQWKIAKIIIPAIIGLILLFSIISIVVAKFVYDGQFPRYDRPDETITANLKYIDIESDYPRELLSFESGNNQLQAYVYGQNQEQGLVVLAHGLGGGADSYLPQITYFVDQGWRVFAYDATGSFDSEGETTRGFPQSLLDLDAALTFIDTQKEFENLPIFLFGHSWGGYAVANILHYDHDITAVASVAAPNSAMEMILEQGQRMMGGFIKTQRPYLWLYQRLLFGKAVSLNTVDAINGSNIPVLIVHGTEDEMVNYNGSSIISNRGNINNPNVSFLSISESGRNGHENLFRSKAALAYIDEMNISYKELYDYYQENIPYEVRQEFYSEIDRTLAQDINRNLMDEINAFYEKALD